MITKSSKVPKAANCKHYILYICQGRGKCGTCVEGGEVNAYGIYRYGHKVSRLN